MHQSASPPRLLLLVVFTVVMLAPLCAHAQVDPISANPNAVQLRHIWALTGDFGDNVGIITATLPDLDGDGRNEFGVVSERDTAWTIYGLDSQGVAHVKWTAPVLSRYTLIAGRFLGPDALSLVVPREEYEFPVDLGLDFYAIDSGRIASAAFASWHSMSMEVRPRGPRYFAQDLDLDGDDELIISAENSFRDDSVNEFGEIWIYEGGPGFRVDSPTVMIRDVKHHEDEFALHIGRVDVDEYPDLVCLTNAGGRIRWGGADLAALDRPVDREFAVTGEWMELLDADGDGQADFLWLGGYLHLSSSGKDPRVRSFNADDADRHFVGRGTNPFGFGPMNDSTDRYDMFGVTSALGDNEFLVFSGAHNGPDSRYDATYSTRADGLGEGNAIRSHRRAGDLDGNGWDDLLVANDRFSGDRGVAVAIGGGPYIPRDSMRFTAIRDVTIDGRHAAVSIWPNPATTVVNIAWRGDLSRTPEYFQVHDALGRLVAQGSADHRGGVVQWHCVSRPSGLYLLTIFDRSRMPLGSVSIVKL